MSQHAQINQVFIFIVALLVIGGIALVGVRSIGSILEQKCTADTLVSKDRLVTLIRNNNDYGTVNEGVITAPCSYTHLCLVDAQAIAQPSIFSPSEPFPGSFIIATSVQDGVEANAFFINTDGEVLSLGFIPELALLNKTEPLCIFEVSGRFSLLLKGQGRTTLVEER